MNHFDREAYINNVDAKRSIYLHPMSYHRAMLTHDEVWRESMLDRDEWSINAIVDRIDDDWTNRTNGSYDASYDVIGRERSIAEGFNDDSDSVSSLKINRYSQSGL